MTPERSRAYTRLLRMLRSTGEPLTEQQRERLMLAADAFVFARSWDELEARVCLFDMRRLAEELMERWTAEALEEMLDDLERCGPDRNLEPLQAPARPAPALVA